MKILGIIPARYASTRFPAKPLADIAGKTMINRVYDQANLAACLTELVVATDHQKIFDHVISFGGKAVMTSESHQSGTDRACEAMKKMSDEYDFAINIQGDEPFIDPGQVELLAECFAEDHCELATLVKKIEHQEELSDPNQVRVVLTTNSEAIYFSRATIPYQRGTAPEQWLDNHTYYKHVGIYGYRTDILRKVSKLKPSSLETAECLEQLRWIENGLRIKTRVTDHDAICIDTPEDLQRALAQLQAD